MHTRVFPLSRLPAARTSTLAYPSDRSAQHTAFAMDYALPAGVHAIPPDLLDLRPDSEIDNDLLTPRPVTSEKNVWFTWHNGYPNMHPYSQRNIRAWHRRFSKQGWTIRVLDYLPSSPLNVSNYLDTSDPAIFPKAFREGDMRGDYAVQHQSDLVRWPLLLKYGGVWADAGLMQIGDLDLLWNQTIGNPESPYEVLTYNCGGVEVRDFANYFMCSRPNNPFYLRCHRLLLALWNEDGGKMSTEGMHSSALLAGLPLMGEGGDMRIIENGKEVAGPEEVSRMLTDYIIQGQAMTMVTGLIDEEDDWNGPEYVAAHVYAIEFMEGSQLINDFTAWDGPKAYKLMSLPLPKEGEEESAEQKEAREIVEGCLSRSFGFKLATGLILRVMGPTLSSLWREHVGSDDVPGTYAHWLRHGTIYWCPERLPPRLEFEVLLKQQNRWSH